MGRQYSKSDVANLTITMTSNVNGLLKDAVFDAHRQFLCPVTVSRCLIRWGEVLRKGGNQNFFVLVIQNEMF